MVKSNDDIQTWNAIPVADFKPINGKIYCALIDGEIPVLVRWVYDTVYRKFIHISGVEYGKVTHILLRVED